MRDDIISKLYALLISRVELSEAETLYVLVQIRKLSEGLSEEESRKYSTLLFYCDWALHTKLDRNPAKRILEELGEGWVPGWGSDEKEEFFGFATFGSELAAFLKEFNLPTNITENQDDWFEFRKNVIQILMDTPLESRGTKIIKFSILKQPSTIGISSDDYLYWYQVMFDNGEMEEWNVMLGDYGPKRRKIVQDQIAHFLQRFANKVKYRKEIADQKKSEEMPEK